MDSRIGLDYIVDNSDYVAKLAAALDTHNESVKKQVFELLSALCAYSSDGYRRAVETLENYKNLKNERYRFNIVVVELDRTSSLEYQVTLLAFINCVIISARSLKDRIRVRNEFIGLNLLPVLSNLRRIANSVPDLSVQLDVFDEQRECDESQSLQGPDGINLNSHLDVFYAILRQVADTPQEIPFLSILQHLLRIDSKDAISDIIWDTAETLVHRATLVEKREDSARLLRSPSVQKFSCPHCCTSPNRKSSLPPPTTPISPIIQTQVSNTGAPPAPPPPPLLGVPPPPPPPMMAINKSSSQPPQAPPAPPANNLLNTKHNEVTFRPKTPETTSNTFKPLPQQEIPTPRAKMKTINWNKIPPNKVVGKNNIWAIVADSHQNSPMADLNWDEMEGLFCQQSTQGSPKLGRDNSSNSDTLERRSKKDNEITLLDGKRSLNVNIFLKQFRSSNEEIIELIRNGEHDEIGAEKLRGLLKILPEVDEFDMLKNFEGDKQRLGNAEKFLMQMLQVPNYKLRIESMLLKEEFAANLGYLEPSINAMLYAAEDLMMNKSLQEVLYMVVVVGNFLNAGGYAGNAAGFKLTSLQKLTDIRANKPGMNLIHFVALQAEKKNSELLLFPEQMTALENASKTTVEQVNNEIVALDVRIKKIKRQIESPTTEEDIKIQMEKFLSDAECGVTDLQRAMKELEQTRIQLSEFFCEDSGTFKLEECFKIFYNFCEKFRQAVKENEKRRIQEEQANIRRKQREEQLANRRRQLSQAGTPVSDSENSFLMDAPLYDIRYSPALSRRRIGSFNNNGEVVIVKDGDGMSPDITPNGSLRRRRSRVLSEEDEGNLMDFLRSSGHDNTTRERKGSSYGSLDRSWARRARSGSGSKKRPDLLNVDFGMDRERPSSPSPLVEVKPIAQEEPKPRISREWRQKIESWLQANEQDEKQNEEYRRKMRRVTSNRRSLETDTESEKGSKLDPLPEEKSNQSSSVNPQISVQAVPSASSTTEPYRRVYPEWKPSTTLEKTDVVGTIEALAGMTYVQAHVNPSNARDKSAWRKSALNAADDNSDMDTRRYRRQRSREGSLTNTGSPLHSIIEEDKKRNEKMLQSHSQNSSNNSTEPTSPEKDNKQTIYIRQQDSLDSLASSNIAPISSIANKNSIYIRPDENNVNISSKDVPNIPRRIRKIASNEASQIQDKIEIDSDNIETPPSVRKSLNINTNNSDKISNILSSRGSIRSSLKKEKDEIKSDIQNNPIEQEILGDGQFDRFSLARRTRRFKRPTDLSSTNDDTPNTTNTATTSPDSVSDSSFSLTAPQVDIPMSTSMPADLKSTQSISESDAEKNERLKRWKEKSQMATNEVVQTKEAKEKENNNVISRIGKIGRNISRISQEDVREAIRSLKSPTPEREWTSKELFRTNINEKGKIISHELNDEGFEETQSLVSDTPSHGKESISSCNEDKIKRKTIRVPSDSAVTVPIGTPKRPVKPSTQLQTLLSRNQQALERSRSMRQPNTPLGRSDAGTPRRTNSLRRPHTETQSVPPTPTIKRFLNVERSNSKSSLRSSRSSLNSAVSTNTVKKMPLKPVTSPSKKPLILQNSSTTTNNTSRPLGSRVPASRSSSSGSSIGPVIRKLPPTSSSTPRLSTSISTSFKENQKSPSKTRSTMTSSRSASQVASSISSPQKHSSNINQNRSQGGFMRPTTSSASKLKSK